MGQGGPWEQLPAASARRRERCGAAPRRTRARAGARRNEAEQWPQMDQVWQPGDRPAGTTTNKHARPPLAQRTALHRRRDGLGADLLHAWRCRDSCGSGRGARSIEAGKRPPAPTDSRPFQLAIALCLQCFARRPTIFPRMRRDAHTRMCFMMNQIWGPNNAQLDTQPELRLVPAAPPPAAAPAAATPAAAARAATAAAVRPSPPTPAPAAAATTTLRPAAAPAAASRAAPPASPAPPAAAPAGLLLRALRRHAIVLIAAAALLLQKRGTEVAGAGQRSVVVNQPLWQHYCLLGPTAAAAHHSCTAAPASWLLLQVWQWRHRHWCLTPPLNPGQRGSERCTKAVQPPPPHTPSHITSCNWEET